MAKQDKHEYKTYNQQNLTVIFFTSLVFEKATNKKNE